MSDDRRFRKTPRRPIDDWIDKFAPDASRIRASSYAHLCRIMYSKGILNKTALLESVTGARKGAQAELESRRSRGATPEEIQSMENQIAAVDAAFDEVSGLPDDPPQPI